MVHSARNPGYLLLLALALCGCDEARCFAPSRSPQPGLRVVVFVPGDHSAGPVLLRAGEREQWLVPGGPAVAFEAPPPGSSIRLHDPSRRFHPLVVAAPPPGAGLLRLPLLARTPLHGSVYRAQLDLFLELVLPWNGTDLARWRRLPLRVRLPGPGEGGADYDRVFRECMAQWNFGVGRELFTVAGGDTAEVVVRLEPDGPTGWVTAWREAGGRRPARMEIQLRDQWSADRERWLRYVVTHELGHVLGLWGHSVELHHVMGGRAVLRPSPAVSELVAARWLWSLPEGFDLGWLRPIPSGPRAGAHVRPACVSVEAAATAAGIARSRPRRGPADPTR